MTNKTLAELASFIKEGEGYSFSLTIPRRYLYSEKALESMEIPFLAFATPDQTKAHAINLPCDVCLTAERIATLYSMSGFSRHFMFTLRKPDEADLLFDCIYDFLSAFDDMYCSTSRRPNQETLDTIKALDKLAALVWSDVGFRRVVLENWRWEDKRARGEGQARGFLTSFENLGISSNTDGKTVTDTNENIDSEMKYQSPLDRSLFKERVRLAPQVDASEVQPTSKVLPDIPAWMLNGVDK